MTDPFAAPAAIPTEHPNISSFRGRLILISPRKSELKPDNFNKGAMKDQITADVLVVDGMGPVPVFKNFEPTGQFLEGPEFRGVWFDGTRVVTQLTPSIPSGMVLARVDTYKPGTRPGPGNPWGLIDPTEEDKQIARNFLATRAVGAATAPAPAQPAYTPPPANFPTGHSVQTPVPYPQTTTAQAPPAAPSLPLPGSAPAGVNPFATPQA